MGQPLLAGIVLLAIVTGEIAFFHATYAPVIEKDLTRHSFYNLSQSTRRYVPENTSLLMLGDDWSSALPYYSQRKSLALPDWTPLHLVKQVFDDPEKFFGGQKLGGVVHCTHRSFGNKAPLVEAFVAGRAVIASAGPCRLLSATR